VADLQSANRIERVKQASTGASNVSSWADAQTAQPDRNTANLGDSIREVRLSKGLSLKELAAQAGLSRAFVNPSRTKSDQSIRGVRLPHREGAGSNPE
jgi:ribosome-binding protein aMBF1 (putative translation factor)